MQSLSVPQIICTTILIEKSPQALPLGAACIASALKHNPLTAGKYQVLLTSVSAEDRDFSDALHSGNAAQLLVRKLLSYGMPQFICFSVYVWNRNILEQTAEEIKKQYPEIICIAGGPEITADPFSSTSFDYTVAGEGETAVPDLIAQLSAGQNKTEILPQGVFNPRKEHQTAASVFAHALPPDINNSISPWLDGTIDPQNYGGVLWELARGCPFKCAYCYESKGAKEVRYFSMERIEKELDLFAQKKVPQVFVLDPTYNADKKRALKILHLISKKISGTFFYFEGRAEFIDRELAEAFTEIPCALQIGLQSIHEEVLEKVHRTLAKKLFIKNIGILNHTGVIFGFDLIYGLPGDTLSGFCESIDFALSLYPNNLELFCLSVLPGTDLYDTAEGLGLVWDKKPPYHVQHTDRFPSDSMQKAELLSMACSLYYNQGRAVPWFNSILRPIHCKPSVFLADFAAWIKVNHKDLCTPGMPALCLPHEQIEEIQLDFIKKKYTEKNIPALLPAAEDIIKMNGALSRTQADGIQQTVYIRFHPDDIMSEYASDIAFFTKNAEKKRYMIQTFMTAKGADWKILR
ncbi:MAG: radical SAM protein [Treponema sp.]|nr:radical SAM protein [Treponema sp.]